MAGALEGKVEKYLDQEVQRIGGITRKWTSPGRVGVPDRIVILDGDVHFVEVKTTTGKLSPMQVREIARLREQRALVHVVYGDAGVDAFILKLLTDSLSADEEELR